jgi:hypothetical protein
MVALTLGPNRWDPTCIGNDDSLPHLVVGTNPSQSERLFASGNERTPLDISKLTINGKKAGYFIGKEDHFRFIVDMMNMNMDDRVVYLTMTYDFIDGKLPTGYQNIKPVWLDVDQCGMSEVEAPEGQRQFSVDSKPWTPNIEGNIVSLFGHLHVR